MMGVVGGVVFIAAVAAAVSAQPPVSFGARVVAGGSSSREHARGLGGGVSVWWRRSATISSGLEAGALDFGSREARFPGPPQAPAPYVYIERTHERVGAVTAAARAAFPTEGPTTPFVAAGTGLYLLVDARDVRTEPDVPGDPEGNSHSTDIAETFGVNLGGGLLIGGRERGAVVLAARAHFVIGGGSGVLAVLTVSAGLEW